MKNSILIKSSMILSILIFQGCGSSSQGGDIGSKPLTPQNEPYYKFLWHLNAKNSILNRYGYSINPEADAHIEAAWNITKGRGVKVAIIDDGFEVRHEDIKDNVISTYNAVTGSSNVQYYGFDGIHGNACAGFIAAPINRVGIVGVAPESKLIMIKQDSYSDSDLIKAFEYAKNQGAKVVSCSWGTGQVSQAIEAELKSLYDAGITILFASGNNGEDLDTNGSHDESEVPWVIGVGASGEDNDVTGYSDYGYNIDLIAPAGDRDLSIGVLGLDDTGYKGSGDQEGLVNSNYAFTNGTSFACPIVAGAVALMYSIKPNLTPKQVREILIRTTDKVGIGANYDNDGFDTTKRRAYGKININRAIDATSRY